MSQQRYQAANIIGIRLQNNIGWGQFDGFIDEVVNVKLKMDYYGAGNGFSCSFGDPLFYGRSVKTNLRSRKRRNIQYSQTISVLPVQYHCSFLNCHFHQNCGTPALSMKTDLRIRLVIG